METKIVRVFYDIDNLPYKDKECSVHFPVIGSAFLGASNTTKIRFYYSKIGNEDVTWVSVAKLPNGKQGSKVLPKASDEFGDYAELQLSNWYTQAKGDVFIALQGYQGGVEVQLVDGVYQIVGTPTIQTTGAIKLAINYAPIGDSADYNDEFTTYQQILAKFGEKLDVTSGIVVVDSLSNVVVANYENGQMFYEKNSHNIFILSDSTFTIFKDYIIHQYEDEGIVGATLTAQEKLVWDKNNDIVILAEQGYQVFTPYYKVEEYGSTVDYIAIPSIYQYSNGLVGFNIKWLSIDKISYAVTTNSATYQTYNKSKIDELISTVKANSFIVITDYVTYPTLQDFLDNYPNPEEGDIYLYPIDPSNPTDYEKYIYEGTYPSGSWIHLGTTELDLTNYYTKDQVDTMVNAKLNKSSYSHIIYGTNTDGSQGVYSLVYNNAISWSVVQRDGNGDIYVPTIPTGNNSAASKKYVDDVREIAEGKTNTWVISDTDTISTVKAHLQSDNTKKIALLGLDNSLTDITTAFLNGDYDNESMDNAELNSQESYIYLGDDSSYLICRNVSPDGYYQREDYYYILVKYDTNLANSNIKMGDIVLIIQTNVPDRWFDGLGWYKLETFNEGIVYKTNAHLIPSANDTYDLGSSSYTFKDLYLGGWVYADGIRSNISGNSTRMQIEPGTITFYSHIVPNNSNRNIGSSILKWKDIYLAGNLTDGTFSYTIEDSYCLLFGYRNTPDVEDNQVKLSYKSINNVTIFDDLTITLESEPTSCSPEYRMNLVNADTSSHTVTFPSGSVIICNDDLVLINNNVLTLPADVELEVSIVDDKVVAINFEA